jgi:hypothetical protein
MAYLKIHDGFIAVSRSVRMQDALAVCHELIPNQPTTLFSAMADVTPKPKIRQVKAVSI